MSLPETMGPGTTRWRCALMLLINNNFPCLRVPCLSRLVRVLVKYCWWLRFRKLRSWGAWDRVQGSR